MMMNKDRNALIAWIANHRPTHAITLNPNIDGLPIAGLRKLFGAFCREVDRLRFRKRNVERIVSGQRFQAFAFPEHLASNSHLHVAACLGPTWLGGIPGDSFLDELAARWDRLSRYRGQMFIKPRSDQGWLEYITKELCRRPDDVLRKGVDFFWSSDYHSNDSVQRDGDLNRTIESLKFA